MDHPFESLTPDFLIAAVEQEGFICDGHVLPLNSYENRVYQIGIENQGAIIAKFYRPQRWNTAQILEEHHFCYQLVEHELPIITPQLNSTGESLFQYEGFSFAIYPKIGGHAPEIDNLEHLTILGRMLGRIHLVAATKSFQHRPIITIGEFDQDSINLICTQFIPEHIKTAYQTLTRDLLSQIQTSLTQTAVPTMIRTHGDCHIGNILWRDEQPFFVDFDDARMAPAIQDIWMLLSGQESEQLSQLSAIAKGYNEFNQLNISELALIEPLRTLRMLNYSAWLARRWNDPAFPHNFPWFNTTHYWEQHVLELREQLAALQQPPLELSWL